MAQETIPVQGLGTSAAPLAYPVAVGDEFDLMAAFASFDGTGAGSSWVPALQVLAPSGAVMVSTIGATVSAGGSADVTFAPFLENDVASGGGACGGLIDSTATAGATCGVHSAGQLANLVLTSDGADGSTWAAGSGGAVPLPFIRIERVLTAMALPPSTDLAVNFTGASVNTNDGGRSLAVASTTLSPFAGTYFSFDWGTNTHRLNIDAEGLYLVYRYWTMIDYDHGALASPALIGLMFSDSLPVSLNGHGWMMTNVNAAGGVSELTQQSLVAGDPDVTRLLEDTATIATSGGAHMTCTINHSGQEGNLNQASIGMAAMRIGSYE